MSVYIIVYVIANYPIGLLDLLESADLGHNKAQYNLALMYKDGEGVEKDYNKTFEFSKRSAEGKYYRGVFNTIRNLLL
ncbi:hypothetical protein RhiirA4_468850 [Rhizophagus irregularis]|uniref:Uncharacterized protein n=1 Tax=Rhizophagus irregularis TaxID=588596 RepID=A0A2I1GYG5_9GLOM|nr:hypothetical protein RhiirA4_468850 [Rhizophagus irregularis]